MFHITLFFPTHVYITLFLLLQVTELLGHVAKEDHNHCTLFKIFLGYSVTVFIHVNYGISVLYFTKKVFWFVDWFHIEYIHRKKEIIYNEKTLNDPQNLCTEVDTPHKLPISYSLGLRCYPVLTQVWTGFRDYYSQATQINIT